VNAIFCERLSDRWLDCAIIPIGELDGGCLPRAKHLAGGGLSSCAIQDA
jgi:hypothetical protein